MCTRLVVTSGNPSARSKRICQPNSDSVPVPVRSLLGSAALAHGAQQLKIGLHAAE